MARATTAWSIAFCAVITGCHGSEDGPVPVRVAVAANFASTLDRLSDEFTAETGVRVQPALGSSGQLYAQVLGGAPFDVFLSADTVRPARLVADGAAVPGTRFTYAIGRVALYAPRLAPVRDGLILLRGDRYRHLAIANPSIAPYGLAATQALRQLGVMDAVETRIVRGEHIGQVYEFVRSGAAEAGIVALSQVVRAPPETFWVIPDSAYQPIRQDAVLLSEGAARAGARRFLAFLRGVTASQIIERDGYRPAD